MTSETEPLEKGCCGMLECSQRWWPREVPSEGWTTDNFTQPRWSCVGAGDGVFGWSLTVTNRLNSMFRGRGDKADVSRNVDVEIEEAVL